MIGLALPVFLTVASLAALPRAAQAADDTEAINRVTRMNKKAIEEYENLNFEEARKILKEALEVCTASGLDKHAIKARTHIHMGIVIFAGFKQREVALKQFRKALDIQPDIKLTKSLANPEIQQAFDEAVAAGPEKAETVAGGEKKPPPAPSEVKTLTHEPLSEARQGSAIGITATLDPSLTAEKVVLGYRADGASDFLGREMKAIGNGSYSGEIPSSATSGNLVAYYLEAQGKDGQAIATKGSVADPMIISLKGAPPERKRPSKPDDDEGSKYFLSLQLGSGVGWMTGYGDVNVNSPVDPPGVALAQLGHLAPEIGYFFRPGVLLSIQARLQLVTGATARQLDRTVPEFKGVCGGDYSCEPANGAIAAFAKLTWFFGDRSVRPFASMAAGGGNIRHVAPFKLEKCGSSGKEVCVDSVAAGPILLGPGAGIIYNLNSSFGLVLGVNTQVGFPNFTVNLDVNVGVAVEL